MTTSTHTLEIDGMSGEPCVQKVREALRGVPGVNTDAVRVGGATISCDHQGKSNAACAAIDAAGYKARDHQGGVPNGVEPAKAQNMLGECAGGAVGSGATAGEKGTHPGVTVPGKPADVATPA